MPVMETASKIRRMHFGQGMPRKSMGLIAVIATLNGIIVHVIMISRVLYGLANQGNLPRVLTRLDPTTGTPLRHFVDHAGWLRAAVLGANDGIVSVSSLIVGVAAADPSPTGVPDAGAAGLAAGAMSMAAGVGWVVGVSAVMCFARQRDPGTAWLVGLKERKRPKVAALAQANKTARVAGAILRRNEVFAARTA